MPAAPPQPPTELLKQLPDGDPDPSCFSSLSEFRHRTREALAAWCASLCW